MNQSDGAEIDINCPECGRIRLSGWCNPCEFRWMNSTFSKSGNKYIDLLILQTQKNATRTCDYLEFIDFNNIEGFEYVAKGGFGSVYEGYWMEGPRWVWDEVSAAWCRNGPTKVALKKLDDSQEPSMNFLKQLETYHRCLQSGSMADCFGITRDETGCFMFVMRYYENGNIYDYLESNKGIISWRDMVDMLWGIAGGLERIHSEGLFHSNLHGGNLLVEDDTISTDAKIADVGINGPAYQSISSDKIIGVLPFIDPQVILGNQPPNQASDIYSFGIIMWVLSTGLRPHCNRAHDLQLTYEICYENLRPVINEELRSEMPEEYFNLMNKCWDRLPENRPTAFQLYEELGKWINAICDDPNPSEISNNFGLAEEKRWKTIKREIENNKLSKDLIHEDAIYTSRIFDFSIIQKLQN
ncbi:kinase-like domain-containing protein [Gigaspora rosea]|uniref:Kinase-like domain-containing protein n=1 Tax=Gigaspora rosea TaxID=44941 RepID=A0A397VMG1_9GLOM|nr:kinase-like domain-containing protein [Gigaspora rosea]